MAVKTERKRIYLSSPTMHGEEQKFVQEAFDTNWVAPLGPNVNALEQEMAEYTGCGHAAALSAGTAAIHLALKLLGVKQGDIVFAPALTFSATCNPIAYEKAVPVFIDSEPDTWNMSPEALERAFETYPNPKAVVCVHLYGTPAKLDEILAICKKHNVPMLEDAAESLSSTYKGKQTGTFGSFGIYSFNGNKIITSSGGGMLVSGDEAAIQKATFLATQARDPARHYQHSQIGYNYRMSNIVAGIGRGQLIHLEEHKAKKQEIYNAYKEAFADIPQITMNPMNGDGDANNWLSCMTISPECMSGAWKNADGVRKAAVTPNMLMDALEELNVETRPIWKPMQLQPVFADCDFFVHEPGAEYPKGAQSVSEDVFNRGLCLPSDIKNTDEDMRTIIDTIRGMFV